MKQQVIALLKPLALLEVTVLAVLGVICFFGGGRSIEDYFTALIFGGALLFGMSPLSLSLSNQNRPMSPGGPFHPGERTQLVERSRSGRLQLSNTLPRSVQLLMIVGVFNVVVGLALQAVVG